jgi:hypothetical protein
VRRSRTYCNTMLNGRDKEFETPVTFIKLSCTRHEAFKIYRGIEILIPVQADDIKQNSSNQGTQINVM